MLGIGLILAPVTVLVRDTDRFIPIVMRVLFYCSPVIYSIEKIPQNLHFVYNFNPTVGMLVLSRAMFFPQELKWNYVADSAAITAVIFAIGVVVFTRLENAVLKEI